MLSHDEYLKNERARLASRRQAWENAPLAVRKQAADDYAHLLCNPAALAEGLRWLRSGDYGAAEKAAADEILANPRLNRPAALGQLLAGVECQCPGRGAAAAYKKLTAAEKATADAVFAAFIENPDPDDDGE
jgi:hypothetical protein